MEIDYTDAQGKSTTRVVHPYCLEPGSASGHGTYLMAKDEMSKQVRSFKLERIGRVKVLTVQYRLPPDFSLADHLRDSWGIWSSDPAQDVVLRFRPPAARRVAESNWHPSQQLRHLDDGEVELTLRVRGTVEVMPWIQGWGSDVEVLAPARLREAVALEARATAARYPEGNGGNATA